MQKMQEDTYKNPIDFFAGTQDEYDRILSSGAVSEEDVYYVEDVVNTDLGKVHRNKLYIGENLIGDSYISEQPIEKRVTNPIGLIQYGTTLGELLYNTGGSLSRVIDMMLFTDRAPSIDECAVIVGIIPSVDIAGHWTNTEVIEKWISEYVRPDFDRTRYQMFFHLEGDISTLFTIVPDREKSEQEYGQDTGIYTGRMFVAIPRGNNGKLVNTIIDKVFDRVYSGPAIEENFNITDIELEPDRTGEVFDYKLYLFNTNQNIMTRIDMEYTIDIRQ